MIFLSPCHGSIKGLFANKVPYWRQASKAQSGVSRAGETASQRLPEGGRSQQPIALERSAPTEPGTKQANYFTTGRITREAWLASCQMVLIAATPGSVMKWLMGAPVCGFGS